MNRSGPPRVAIVYPGDREVRQAATADNNRFANLFRVFAESGALAEPAVYHDDFADDVQRQLLSCDAVLVWRNPIEEGRDRSVLDALLRQVAHAGIFVSAHPDVILQLGTKEVLYRTRELGWGCDTHLYYDEEQLRRELPARLASGEARVLKQNRGHSGQGIWRVQLAEPDGGALPTPNTRVRVKHAQRGASEESITLGEFCALCAGYFRSVDGRIIDQAWQQRLHDGMTRCYLVHDRVAGFGHQAINALHPAGLPPGPRLYHPPDDQRFQALKRVLESEWIPALQNMLQLERDQLPVLWDCDFLLGPRTTQGEDTYVLCEINASSVAPYPDSAVPRVVDATLARVRSSRNC